MNKQILSPFDCDMCAMIEDITKQPVNVVALPDSIRIMWDYTEYKDAKPGSPQWQQNIALQQAIRGRLGDRFIDWHFGGKTQGVHFRYDPTEYPEEIRTRLTSPDYTAGKKYCRTLLEVDAIQVSRDNVDDLLRFTGGGNMTSSQISDEQIIYSFADNNGILRNVPETWYIVREPNGRLVTCPERDFNREFEPKDSSKNIAINVETTPYDVQRLFNELFGTDLRSRFNRLDSEYAELAKVIPKIYDRNISKCSDELLNDIIDKLSEVHGVLFQIAGILGLSQWELVLYAYNKVKGITNDQWYKQKHPYQKPDCTGCGNCIHFTNEDSNGYGYCDKFQSKQRCGTLPCTDYKIKK